MILGQEALKCLQEGNCRFISGIFSSNIVSHQDRRNELAARQESFAIILGCSDSRAPTEIIFDQALGKLFFIRVDGNIVAPSQVGCLGFSAERFSTRLVVVGHLKCRAILATIEVLKSHPETSPEIYIRSLIVSAHQ
jgi:carbonic anhydrase